MLRFIFFLFVPLSLFAKPLSLKVSSESALLMNAETGDILFEKDAYSKKNPASTTKIATALYAISLKQDSLETMFLCHPDALSTVSQAVKISHHFTLPSHWLEPDGVHYSIRKGEELSFKDLLYGMMLISGNDAANVIAKNIAGDIPSFMQSLNGYLKKIGCKNTYYTNPHGLYHPDHYTTAYDLALMTKEAFKYPFFREIVGSTSYQRPKTNKQESQTIYQTNLLMKKGKFYYPNALGGKSGYVKKAGHNLVAAAQGAGRTLIAVVLKCGDKFEPYRDVIALFDAAFAEKKDRRLILKGGENSFTKEIKKAKKPLHALLLEDVYLEYFPSEEPEVKTEIKWKECTLPIKDGEIVGEIVITNTRNGKSLKKATLYSVYPVEKTFFYRVFDFIKGNFIWIILLLIFGGFGILIPKLRK